MSKATVYHTSGVEVELDVGATVPPGHWKVVLDNISAAISAGFLPRSPGADVGEKREDVVSVYRSVQENAKGETSVIHLFFAGKPKWAEMKMYLNTDADIAAFTAATGIDPEKMDIYTGEGGIERGKSTRNDKLIIDLRKPVGMFWRPNPKYDPNETDVGKKKPSKLFSRWADQNPDPAPAPAVAAPVTFDREKAVATLDGLYLRLKTTWRDAIGRTEARLKARWPDRADLRINEGPQQLTDDEIKFMISALEKAAG